jgi:hypothetical protein
MKLINKVLIASVGVLFLGALVAQAAPYNESTRLTFSKPVAVPGTVLPAGTYNFCIAPGMGARNLVQIWNANDTKLITQLWTIPDYRFHISEKTIIQFHERQAKSPLAMKAWFYPGLHTGAEFAYPQHQAARLAQLKNGNAHAAATS